MAVKIRLRRVGAKKAPFYRVVVADSRFPRDGRFIEEIGTYDPNKEPSEIKIDAEKAKQWIANGAQPTDTVRVLLLFIDPHSSRAHHHTNGFCDPALLADDTAHISLCHAQVVDDGTVLAGLVHRDLDGVFVLHETAGNCQQQLLHESALLLTECWTSSAGHERYQWAERR